MSKHEEKSTKNHTKRRYKVGDPDFKPPDGGWGWVIVLACGFSNLCTSAMYQQFGLVFRERFQDLEISNAQTTAVTNINFAFNSCVGLLNGPLFKILTYRQVAMFGAVLVMVSLLTSTFCASFWTYLIFYGIFYGSGIGINQSSNALALNTYFKEKRRIATGLSWTTTALGPIIWPYVLTVLIDYYDVQGTVLIFAAFSGHALVGSLLLQPVEWHTAERELENGGIVDTNKITNQNRNSSVNHFDTTLTKSKSSIFSSQYMFNEDDHHKTGYEIIDPGLPMMTKANDGWYSQNRSLAGSRMSLSSGKQRPGSQNISQRPSYANLSEAKKERKVSQSKPAIVEECENHNDVREPEREALLVSMNPNQEEVLKNAAVKLADLQEKELEEEEEKHKKLTLFEKIYIFFDFDLLKDRVYVNLMLGITVANFVEINFSILTPMVLTEFNFEKFQVATFMSLLGATDICVRFFVPFLAGKIGWDNRTFFLVGVLAMAFGRVLLVHTQTYYVGLLVAVIIGAGKGLRTIFMALVIPGHVSLEKLPAASGLQLATSGLFFFAFGPLVGWIRDTVDDYVLTLHILNLLTYGTAIAWTLEKCLTSNKNTEQKTEKKELHNLKL